MFNRKVLGVVVVLLTAGCAPSAFKQAYRDGSYSQWMGRPVGEVQQLLVLSPVSQAIDIRGNGYVVWELHGERLMVILRGGKVVNVIRSGG